MGFEGQLSDADKACKHERDEDVRDVPPLYRLMFTITGSTLDGCVRAWFERLEGTGTKSRWLRLYSGEGADEASAIKALRDARYEERSLGRELKAFAARKAVQS